MHPDRARVQAGSEGKGQHRACRRVPGARLGCAQWVRAVGARNGCAPCALTGRAFVVSPPWGWHGWSDSERAQAPPCPAWSNAGARNKPHGLAEARRSPYGGPGSSGRGCVGPIAIKKKGRQALSGDSAAPNLGLLLCRGEKPHTSDTCGRLASCPNGARARLAARINRDAVSFHATQQQDGRRSSVGICTCGPLSGVATLPLGPRPARGAPARRAVCALRSGSRQP